MIDDAAFTQWNQEEYAFQKDEKMPHQEMRTWKVLYIKITIIILFAGVFITLFNLQVVHGALYTQESTNNRIYVEQVVAPRGIIYDRNGIPLVYNKDTFKVIIDKNIFDYAHADTILQELSQTLSVNLSNLMSIYTKGVNDPNTTFITMANDISKDQMIEITTNPIFKGVRAESSVIRVYPYKEDISNILGYTGPVSDTDLATDSSLNALDAIGKDGLEYQYDKQLRGVDGENIIEVDTNHNQVTIIKEQPPIPGDNLTLSIDINAQQRLEAAVAQGVKDSSATGGAGIIENVNDGSIIAMVTSPTYDDNLFAQGISSADYANLANDPNHPLINRPIQERQPPGSVMKTITASAALQENAITQSTIFDSEGTFEYGGQTFQDYNQIKRGKLNVIGGLRWSSNIFFYNTILSLGINKLLKYENLFDAGEITGIDLPGETRGILSSPTYKQEQTGQVWYGGDSLLAAIGQGFTEVTPIEVVNWVTAIANGGVLYRPNVVMKVTSYANSPVSGYDPHVIRQDFVSQSNLDIVKQGMHEAVDTGIDRTLFTNTVDIAGKTGTAEFGDKINGVYQHEHAWASGFAPFNKPQISFVVLLEDGGLSTSSEKVAKAFLDWYYGTYLKGNPNIL